MSPDNQPPALSGAICEQALAQASAALGAGRLDEAEALCRQLLRLAPDRIEALHLSGIVALERGDLAAALAHLSRAAAGAPDDPVLHNNLGEALRAAGRKEAAERHFRRAATLDPGYARPWLGLGNLLREADGPRALDCYRGALARDPDLAEARDSLALALAVMGEQDAAEAEFRTLVAAQPDYLRGHLNLARLLRERGRPAEAAAQCRTLLERDPANADGHYNLSLALLDLGLAEEAAAACRHALDNDPDHVEALVQRGILEMRGHRPDTAIECFRQALARRPDLAHAHGRMANAFERLNRLDEAAAAARQAVARDADEFTANLVLARLDHRAPRMAAARARLERVAGRAPKGDRRGTALIELGLVLDRLGDCDAAFAAFTAGQRERAATPEAARCDGEALFELLRRLKAGAGEAMAAAGPAAAPDPEAPVFLIGFPRSGTTLMEQIFAAHPNLVTTGEHPLVDMLIRDLADDYPECVAALDEQALARMRARYRELATDFFGGALAGRRVVDKQPLNLLHLGLIRRLFPGAPVVMALRDPRDVVLSCFMQNFALNRAMAQFLDLERAARFYAAAMDLWLAYRELLQPVALVSRYEDIVDDVEGAARRLIGHTGQPWDAAVLRYAEGARSRHVRTPSFRDVTVPVFRRARGRWHHYAEHLAPVLPLLTPYVEAFGYGATADDSPLPSDGNQ